GDPGVRAEEGRRRPAVPADDEAHARLGRHRGRDGAVPRRVQGNLPAEDAHDGRNLVSLKSKGLTSDEAAVERSPPFYFYETCSLSTSLAEASSDNADRSAYDALVQPAGVGDAVSRQDRDDLLRFTAHVRRPPARRGAARGVSAAALRRRARRPGDPVRAE